MMKRETLFASQGGPIILSQVWVWWVIDIVAISCV
ncbi:hypothetical protein CMV_025676, partial [Castanea mollissima]